MSDTENKADIFSATHLEADSESRSSPATQFYDKYGNILIPQPMDDANDPLNWSALRKIIIITTVAAWTFLGTFQVIIVGSAFFDVTAEFHNNFAVNTYLVGGPVLSYGVASLFWVAVGNRFGVRLCFFASPIIAGCLSIWGAKATTFGQLVAARTLAGLAFASPETLGPQVVADVFFVKDRTKCMAFITAMQASGFALGPLAGGFIVRDLGWRWTQYILAILTFSVAVIIFVFFPETQYTSDLKFAVTTRSLAQQFKFTRVSGGGRAKVHRYTLSFFVISVLYARTNADALLLLVSVLHFSIHFTISGI